MSEKNDFTNKVKDNLKERIDGQDMRPNIEIWPVEDEFARWVAYHEARERAIICSSPEHRDTPFCGTGYH